ncbi:hypothetical protein PG990_010351 [Apiospora arundinis]
MPRHAFKGRAGVDIDITDFQSVYVPGDTVLGHVSCSQPFFSKKPMDASRTEVRIRLFGRSKTKVVRESQNSTQIYRGRAVLFDQSHIVSQGATPQPGFASRGDDWSREKSELASQQPVAGSRGDTGADRGHRDGVFLSSSQDDVTKHELPSVFYFSSKSGWSGSKFEAYIEYVLEASLVCPGADNVTAQFPLFIRKQSTAKPIKGSDYKFRIREATRLHRTEMLLAENAERKMTFRERQRRFWNPSKTPKYTYVTKVVHPTVIQLEHPDPVPFKFFIVPKLHNELTSICPDGDLSRLPPVKFVSIELSLKAKTRIRTPGTFSKYHKEEREHEFPIPFRLSLANYGFNVPLVVRGNIRDEPPPEYTASKASTKLLDEKIIDVTSSECHDMDKNNSENGQFSIRPVDDNIVNPHDLPMLNYSNFVASDDGHFSMGSPFNLGAHLGIRLSQTGSTTLGAAAETPFGRCLYPSFDTYNISLTYQLEWTIRLICAGEAHEVRGVAGVRVLPPNEEREADKKALLGPEGKQKNYDNLAMAMGMAETAAGLVVDVLGAI